jgi:hypothetical protein
MCHFETITRANMRQSSSEGEATQLSTAKRRVSLRFEMIEPERGLSENADYPMIRHHLHEFSRPGYRQVELRYPATLKNAEFSQEADHLSVVERTQLDTQLGFRGIASRIWYCGAIGSRESKIERIGQSENSNRTNKVEERHRKLCQVGVVVWKFQKESKGRGGSVCWKTVEGGWLKPQKIDEWIAEGRKQNRTQRISVSCFELLSGVRMS